MQFFYAKHEHICTFCKAIISKREVFVRVLFKNRQGTGTIVCLFHPHCYPAWSNQVFTRKFLYWKERQIPPKKRGRPLIPCSDRPKRQKLMSLMIYHRKLGHMDRVEELQKEIEVLEGR